MTASLTQPAKRATIPKIMSGSISGFFSSAWPDVTASFTAGSEAHQYSDTGFKFNLPHAERYRFLVGAAAAF